MARQTKYLDIKRDSCHPDDHKCWWFQTLCCPCVVKVITHCGVWLIWKYKSYQTWTQHDATTHLISSPAPFQLPRHRCLAGSHQLSSEASSMHWRSAPSCQERRLARWRGCSPSFQAGRALPSLDPTLVLPCWLKCYPLQECEYIMRIVMMMMKRATMIVMMMTDRPVEGLAGSHD